MNKSLILPSTKELQQRASLILSKTATAVLNPKFFNYNQLKAELEGVAYEPGDGTNNYDRIGMLGLPVFDTVKLISPQYKDDLNKTIASKTLILDIALIDVTNVRHIVTTEIAGRNGSVKEYMSNGDSQISIKGSLINELATITPYQLMQDMDFIATCPETLIVESNFLSYLGIFNLVIKQVRYSQQEAMRNIVNYELECISDVSFELRNA